MLTAEWEHRDHHGHPHATSFGYDALSRLRSACTAAECSQGWTHDSLGNVPTRTGIDAAMPRWWRSPVAQQGAVPAVAGK